VGDCAPHGVGRWGLLREAAGARLWQLADGLTSILFPAPCGLCGGILSDAGRIPICRSCLAQLTPWNAPLCPRCGRPFVSIAAVAGVEHPLCHGCRRGMYDFDFARSYGAYSAAMARAIVMLKYQQVTPLAGWFADRLLPLVRENAAPFAADVVVPVPLHAARQRERGYNQAELIARALAKRLKLPCRSHWLARTQPRPEKLRLTVRERWQSVRNAFDIRAGASVDKLRVLLLDDVLTTGATLDACSRALRESGAAYVAAITVARAMPRSQGLETQQPFVAGCKHSPHP
jgi:ComF family protein